MVEKLFYCLLLLLLFCLFSLDNKGFSFARLDFLLLLVLGCLLLADNECETWSFLVRHRNYTKPSSSNKCANPFRNITKQWGVWWIEIICYFSIYFYFYNTDKNGWNVIFNADGCGEKDAIGVVSRWMYFVWNECNVFLPKIDLNKSMKNAYRSCAILDIKFLVCLTKILICISKIRKSMVCSLFKINTDVIRQCTYLENIQDVPMIKCFLIIFWWSAVFYF